MSAKRKTTKKMGPAKVLPIDTGKPHVPAKVLPVTFGKREPVAEELAVPGVSDAVTAKDEDDKGGPVSEG